MPLELDLKVYRFGNATKDLTKLGSKQVADKDNDA